MTSLTLTVTNQPVRVGWCIKSNDFEAMREAVKKTVCFWGGRFNPIIPVDNQELADNLIKQFNVDILCSINDDEDIQKFIESYAYLKVFSYSDSPHNLIDLSFPLSKIASHNQNVKEDSQKLTPEKYEWEENDPLSDLCLLTYGTVPQSANFLKKYSIPIKKIAINEALPSSFYQSSIYGLNGYGCEFLKTYTTKNEWLKPGIYTGSATNFDDLVLFWNLRAAGASLRFYDPNHDDRTKEACDSFIKEVLKDKNQSDPIYAHWSIREYPMLVQAKSTKFDESHALWNGLNVQPIVPFFNDSSPLVMVQQQAERPPQVTFQLPKLISDDGVISRYPQQQYAITVSFDFFSSDQDEWTFSILPVPELNDHYGKHMYHKWDAVRVGVTGLRIIGEYFHGSLSLRAIKKQGLMSAYLKTLGVNASISQSGRIAEQLIRYLGGLRLGWLFKVEGIRDLLRDNQPHQSFTRNSVLGAIGRKPYKKHWMPRVKVNELPNELFKLLLSKKLLRAGLEFKCPRCNLDFWSSIDEVKSALVCEYCEQTFNVLPQLHDRDWKYRRSGLLGGYNNQEGAIPVLLTLQVLERTLSFSDMLIISTAHNLEIIGHNDFKCETDFILIHRTHDFRAERIQVVIGECKSSKKIELNDIKNLERVAKHIENKSVDVYIVFSKTVDFSKEELLLINTLLSDKLKVILFGKNELESHNLFEVLPDQEGVNKYPLSLSDMAKNTVQLYFKGLKET